MAKTLEYYLDKVTTEHNQQPKFMGTLAALLQPLVDTQLVIESLSADEFDLDLNIIVQPGPDLRIGAEGVQLDAVGVRVNRDRFLALTTGAYAMTDAQYRHVLTAVIQANKWDGTIPHADACYKLLFSTGTPPVENQYVVIQDYGNMTMALALFGAAPLAGALFTSAQVIALFMYDHLKLKPAGIKCYYLMRGGNWPLGEISGGPPAFGVGADNVSIRGVGSGYLLQVVRVE